MKLSRAVAIALLVVAACAPAEPSAPTSASWFLIVPNIAADGTADMSQPRSKWKKVETFGSQNDCKYLLMQQQFAVQGTFGPIGNAQSAYQVQALQTMRGRCIAATDPQLKAP